MANYVKMMEDNIDLFLVDKHFQDIRIQFRNGFDFSKLMAQLLLFIHILAMFWVFQSDMMNHKISEFFHETWNNEKISNETRH